MRHLLAATLFVFSTCAAAQVDVKDAWVRSTVPGSTTSAAYMSLHAQENIKLFGAYSPIAKTIKLHKTSIDSNNVMRMRSISELIIKHGETRVLKPGSYHLMLHDVSRELKVGEMVPMTLMIGRASGAFVDKEIQLRVEAAAQEDAHPIVQH